SSCNRHSPHYKADVSDTYGYASTNAYGRIQGTRSVSPTILLEEFYRLAIFCKVTVDRWQLEAVPSFQAVGSS
ncbi:hypothetical protein BCR43DRAFT_418056, partial [Syncephalastrum racemosum]